MRKGEITAQINAARQTLEQRHRDLQDCIDAHRPPPPPPPPPPPAPNQHTFTGRASLFIIHPVTPDPFEADIVVPLEVGGTDQRYRVVRALSLSVLGSRTFSTPAGDVTTTIRLRYPDAQLAQPPYPADPGRISRLLPAERAPRRAAAMVTSVSSVAASRRLDGDLPA